MTDRCFLCGRFGLTEEHHCFGGANRKRSNKFKLKVPLCHFCHNEPPDGVHHNAKNMQIIHEYGQKKYMEEQNATIEDFIREFGKNYL